MDEHYNYSEAGKLYTPWMSVNKITPESLSEARLEQIAAHQLSKTADKKGVVQLASLKVGAFTD